MMLGDWAIPVGPIFLLLGFGLVLGLLAVLIRPFAPRQEAAHRQKDFQSLAGRSFLGVLSQATGGQKMPVLESPWPVDRVPGHRINA